MVESLNDSPHAGGRPEPDRMSSISNKLQALESKAEGLENMIVELKESSSKSFFGIIKEICQIQGDLLHLSEKQKVIERRRAI